jgi:hypothetical protein
MMYYLLLRKTASHLNNAHFQKVYSLPNACEIGRAYIRIR